DGVDYARIAYAYARPGALDDHLRIQPRDVELPELPLREPVADGGARGAVLHDAWDLDPRVDGRALDLAPEPLATRKQVVAWQAQAGERLTLRLPFAEPGAYALQLVAVHAPGAAVLRVRGAGDDDAGPARPIGPRREPGRRVLSVALGVHRVGAGEHKLELDCVRSGSVGLDYLWLLLDHVVVPGCVEAEAMEVIASAGVEHEVQALRGTRSSGGRQLWVRARAVGDSVRLRASGLAPGRRRVTLLPTASRDYGALAVAPAGARRADRPRRRAARRAAGHLFAAAPQRGAGRARHGDDRGGRAARAADRARRHEPRGAGAGHVLRHRRHRARARRLRDARQRSAAPASL